MELKECFKEKSVKETVTNCKLSTTKKVKTTYLYIWYIYHNIMVKFGNDLKILKFLIEHNKEEFSIRSISNILKIDYKNTYLAIEKLRNSINLRKQSGSNFISFFDFFTCPRT